MAKMMYREAVVSTIAAEMERDPSVVVLGEDVVGGMGTAGGAEAKRAFAAMMEMGKIDVAKIEAARRG